VALSDPQGILASPLTVISRQSEAADIAAISDLITRYQVEQVIAGLPRSMDGSLGRQAEKVQTFVRSLSRGLPVPLEFRDERLSTVSARRLMRDNKKRGGRHDDAIAAALILQMYLDESASRELDSPPTGI
jgi:putative Holliday junction resolvase